MGGLKLQHTSGTRSRTDIPQEIIMEIMYRLPASSVAKFRIFSKEWRSLLSEPSFIKTHQVINTLNRNHHILIFKPIAASIASLSLLPFRENQHIEEARPPKNYTPFGDAYDDDDLDVIGCCNGLVLLSACSVSEDDGRLTVFDHRLIVLNPTTKEFLELPSPNCCFDPDGRHISQFKEHFLYGFNYDSFTDDYKVITIFYNLYNVPVVHVYSLRTKIWRHVIDFPYHLVYTWMNMSNAFINGNIHRVATKRDDPGYEPKIVAFRLGDETISEVPSPGDVNIMRFGHLELVDVGGKLGIFGEYDGKVWLMNEYGVKESWTKILFQEIPRRVDQPTLIHKDDGKILVVCRDLKLIYTLDKKGLRKYCDAKSRLWTDLIPKAICVESLVSLNDYGQVNQLARIFDNPS